MKTINKTRYALLGILEMGPRTGYDIKKLTDKSIGFFWNENFGHVYPVLRKMKAEGLVTMRVEKTGNGRPPRNVYSITPKGLKAFKSWLAGPVSDQPVRNELLLRVFFGRHLPTQELAALIQEEKTKNEELLSRYGSIEEKLRSYGSPDLSYRLMTLVFGKSRSRMIIEWCEETLTTIKKLEQEPVHERKQD